MSSSTHEHVFANPGCAGLVALAMACFTFFALLTGRVTHDAAPVLACWMVGGGLIQYACGWMELRNGVIKGGNVFLMFGAFFMFVTAISLFTKYMLAEKGMPVDPRVEGWAWLAAAIGLILWTPAYMKNSPALLFLAVVLIDVALICIAFMDMGVWPKATSAPIAAWALLLAGIIGLYLSGAIMLNTEFGRVILPTSTPLVKEAPRRAVGA